MTQEKIKPYEGIDVVHMVVQIAKSWWKLFIAMLIGAVLLGGLSYYKNAKGLAAAQVKEEQTEADASEQGTYANEAEILADSGLSEKAADEVLYYTNKYYYNKKQYERQNAYLQDSILMQMDPNVVWTITLYYDLSAASAAETSGQTTSDVSIAAAYLAQVSNAATYDRIAEALETDIDSSYFAEVITGSSLDSLSDLEEATVLSDKEDLKIVIRYADQAGCETIAQIIKEQIADAYQTVVSEAGRHKIVLVGEREEQRSDAELLTEQKNAITALGNLSDNVISARTNIEASEEATFNALLAYYEERDMQKESAIRSVTGQDESEDAEAEEEQTQVLQTPQVSKKYVALGMLLGLLLAGAYEACRYFFSDKLKQAKELEEGYGLTVYDSKDQAVISLVLRQKQEKDGLQKICTISSIQNPSADEKELQKIVEADAVMLKEKINTSSHKEIAKVLELCRKFEKPILGVIVED
jgi:ABC-type multidrug transport system fused ATPase/permease subunit